MSEQSHNGEPARKSLLCCVLVLEISGYEAMSVFDQIKATQALKCLLSDAVLPASADHLVTVESEDRAVLCFFSNPTECFSSALRFREASAEQAEDCDLELKIGINLGPVQVSNDAFGRAQVQGAGMRDADLVMGESHPGEIVVSRSFFDVLSRTAQGYASLFKYKGIHEGNDVIPLELYRYGSPLTRPAPLAAERDKLSAAPADGLSAVHIAPATSLEQARGAATKPVAAVPSRRQWHRNKALRYGIAAGLAVLALLAYQQMPRFESQQLPLSSKQIDRRVAPQSPVGLASSSPPTAPELAPAPALVSQVPMTTTPGAQSTSEPIPEAAPAPPPQPETDETRPSEPIPSSIPEAAAAKVKKPAAPQRAKDTLATVHLAVKPWGEIYVDGKKMGVSPPLKSFKVKPGKRVIKVKNNSRPIYQKTIQIKPDARLTLAYEFH